MAHGVGAKAGSGEEGRQNEGTGGEWITSGQCAVSVVPLSGIQPGVPVSPEILARTFGDI